MKTKTLTFEDIRNKPLESRLAVASFSTAGRYLGGNYAAEALWNLPEASPPSFSGFDCFGGAQLGRAFRKAAIGKLGTVCPVHFRRANNSLCILRLRFTPGLLNNRIEKVIVSAEDLTPLLEAALQQ